MIYRLNNELINQENNWLTGSADEEKVMEHTELFSLKGIPQLMLAPQWHHCSTT